jgi:polysaccharide biosynthesis protein PslG
VPRTRRHLAALGAVAALAATAPAQAARREVPRGWLGVTADGPLIGAPFGTGAEWDRLAGSGAESVRTAFWWRDMQPGGPGGLVTAAGDAVVLAAARRGLEVLPVVQGTPGWAAITPGDLASPPRDPADFARYLRALVARYGPRGSLWREHRGVRRMPIRAWQIWNEPNITRYWDAPDWARGYSALLRSAHRALHRADRGARTILAGLPNASWLALRAVYRAGARGAFDVVALHPYTGKVANVLRLVRYARAEMARAHDARRPVWITELSWPAAVGHTETTAGFETTERGQAARLRAGLRRLAAARRSLRIGRVDWYTWLSQEGGPSSFAWSGLRRVRDGRVVSARALPAFRAAARRLEGCAKRSGDALRCR